MTKKKIESAIATLKNAPSKKKTAVMGFVVKAINKHTDKDSMVIIKYTPSNENCWMYPHVGCNKQKCLQKATTVLFL